MNRRDIFRSLALTPLATRLAIPSSAGLNAATLYREAAVKLPILTQAENALLDNVAVTALNGDAKSLVDRSAPSLDLTRLAASVPHCDWGRLWANDGMGTLLDLLGNFRSLAKIADLQTRWTIVDKHPASAIEGFIATIRFGRQFTRQGTFLCQISGFAMEHRSIATFAVSLPRIDRVNLQALADRFKTLPAFVSLAATIEAERVFFIEDYVPHNKAEYDEAKIKDQLAWYAKLAFACEKPGAISALRSSSKTPDQIQFLNTFDNYRLNSIPSIRVKHALFLAAIAIVADGPGAINRVVDPLDGQPFDLRTWTTGFELTSRFALEGKPRAALLVGVK